MGFHLKNKLYVFREHTTYLETRCFFLRLSVFYIKYKYAHATVFRYGGVSIFCFDKKKTISHYVTEHTKMLKQRAFNTICFFYDGKQNF
jgi:hypothetical protein